MQYLYWNGQMEKYIDSIAIRHMEDICLGNYGGSSNQGTTKNEDGAMVFKMENHGVLALLMDAHTSDDSVQIIQSLMLENEEALKAIGQKDGYSSIQEIKRFMESLLLSERCFDQMSRCTGETAVLFVYQYGEFLWWLSIGDNQLYVFHDEFNSLGQYNVNSRIFYQWTGKASSINLKVPCYVTGTIELREGLNRIVLLTDGVLEIEERPFENPHNLEQYLSEKPLKEGFRNILEVVKTKDGKDNATMIGWDFMNPVEALRPSR